ncbi:hypothetical protein PF005_g19324 [Phytophthora fragariae]|uniref:Uncharacterized protein n=2 Tax=Phytophthora TaxID=4783 RepID=A0A6A3XN84_9STRA|nr:hypothetical protein PF003_g30746 [Phytophthora fragariae]KAE8978806.1 hypothetical protein PR001_g24738 [Phytophthora rubi]KAE8929785.1 hypothetical protein PF009_g20110 [Phytophthora fragariae]KAE8991148.1 hypothetical protein PF011_g18055 [Phytophthora fragariae]KAE9002950.1 hypothetical protein PR002_g17485 [Phytophthora rubi]
MMSAQIPSLLQQLAEAFELPTNNLLEEMERLQNSSMQLKGAINSINALMQRMERGKSALSTTGDLE